MVIEAPNGGAYNVTAFIVEPVTGAVGVLMALHDFH